MTQHFSPPAAVEGVDRRTVHVRTLDGISPAGTLRVPLDAPLPAPALLMSPPGPVAVSDQSVVAGYADRFTAAGYVTLALDPRNLGHSGGTPRQHFDMTDRLRDLQAAVSYLCTPPERPMRLLRHQTRRQRPLREPRDNHLPLQPSQLRLTLPRRVRGVTCRAAARRRSEERRVGKEC